MQEIKAQTAAAGSDVSSWYEMYRAALLESDRNRALPKIERARIAIQNRTAELQGVSLDRPREVRELRYALRYLGILLNHVGRESEKVLWD